MDISSPYSTDRMLYSKKTLKWTWKYRALVIFPNGPYRIGLLVTKETLLFGIGRFRSSYAYGWRQYLEHASLITELPA